MLLAFFKTSSGQTIIGTITDGLPLITNHEEVRKFVHKWTGAASGAATFRLEWIDEEKSYFLVANLDMRNYGYSVSVMGSQIMTKASNIIEITCMGMQGCQECEMNQNNCICLNQNTDGYCIRNRRVLLAAPQD
ncbi:MAG TPA: hypothetical protein VEA37_08015 [Flavobacterium sp.]|nr:hypothetical protein [Flavobacterium sp.]